VLVVLFIMFIGLLGWSASLSLPVEPHALTASASTNADTFTLLFFIATSPRNLRRSLRSVQREEPSGPIHNPGATRGY
jgi:hypothetical protein